MHYAAMFGRVEVTELLIGSGASLHVQGSSGLGPKEERGSQWGPPGVKVGKVVWVLGEGVEKEV